MSVEFTLKKTSIVFVLLFCIVISTQAETSIRIRRVKTHLSPRHISLSARTGNGIYARKYSYGRPIPTYNFGKNRRYYAGRTGKRTYASRYRNWTPERNNPRADKIGQRQKRKELYPFLTEPAPGGKKRRNRPYRLSPMQRPKPPKKPNEYDEDYFFPEEAKRAEIKFESRFPRPKKKRRPEFEQTYKAPEIPFYDEKPYKTKPYSYSSFVRHPVEDADELYDDSDSHFSQPVVRNKKKKVKKKSNGRKKNKPVVFEPTGETYPPYITPEDYEQPKPYRKPEEDFVPKVVYTKPKLFDSDYRGSQKTQQTYTQGWSNVETTARPVQYQTENGFQPQYNYQQPTSNSQPQYNTQQTYYSQPDTYKNYYSNQQTYSQPVSSSSTVLTDVTIQKSVPIYDNTETFYNFNNNAYVNSQSSKYYTSDGLKVQNYGTRVSPSSTSYKNKAGEKTDTDTEFIKKHQNLYNNGLSGVPVQGDGFAKETVKKDYDIGYGDFQFDENPNS